jgi:mono/diheme cytochrome c family protein
MHYPLRIAAAASLLLGLAACRNEPPPAPPPAPVAPVPAPPPQPAPPPAPPESGANTYTSEPEWLVQGWTDRDRKFFYGFSQGSQIIPYAWFVALERADGTQRFLADGLSRFGYLPRPRLKQNPDALPVGFARDKDQNGAWIGMNCAACHTDRVVYGGHVYQIDGGPGGGDFGAFIAELAKALDATLADNAKFERFYAAVRPKLPNRPTRDALKAELKLRANAFHAFVQASTPDTPWGPARTDAFNMIFNRVTSIDMDMPGNSRFPVAPVSFPFLWTTNIQDKIQWIGSVDNAGSSGVASFALRLARNVGQVLGVFGKVPGLANQTLWRQYRMRNSVRFHNLGQADGEIGKLKPPPWIGPPVNQALAEEGRALYAKNCAACHVDVRDPQSPQKWPCAFWPATPPKLEKGIFRVCPTPLGDVKTDAWTARLIGERKADTGLLKDYTPLFGAIDKLGRTEKTTTILRSVVIGAILTPWPLPAGSDVVTAPSPGSVQHELHNAGTAQKVYGKKKADTDTLTYKGGPLNGIWATAPYLHNGSVPTLADLLKPQDQRPATFEIGSRVFDPVNVGFVSSPGSGRFVFDTAKDGNSNAGHTYGTGLSDHDRAALLEYLKTL